MRRFVCTSCHQVWYSAATVDKPCEKCGGNLVNEETFMEKG